IIQNTSIRSSLPLNILLVLSFTTRYQHEALYFSGDLRRMSNIAKLEFVALDVSGKNYLSWILDAEIHLQANGLG
ncbi:hypothetical protein LINGRAHAP2_LOCUS34611, partial [Linum grandiflorum]